MTDDTRTLLIRVEPDLSPGAETELAAAARVYARVGWKVFPIWWIEQEPSGRRVCACLACSCYSCRREGPPEPEAICRKDSPGKHPLHVLVPRGVTNASADEDTVAGWWQLYPTANIGLAAGDNGLAILDLDLAKPGAEESWSKLQAYLEAQGQPLPPTVEAITGSGGRHLLFAQPEGGIKNGANVLGPNMPGIDTRGRGGYVVAAPSSHVSGGRYEWINFTADEAPWPEILTQLMAPRPVPRPAVTLKRQTAEGHLAGSADRWASAAMDAEVARVQGTTEGGRNAALNQAAFSLGQIVAGGYLTAGEVGEALLSAALSIGLGETEARKTIISGLRASAGNPRHPQAVAA